MNLNQFKNLIGDELFNQLLSDNSYVAYHNYDELKLFYVVFEVHIEGGVYRTSTNFEEPFPEHLFEKIDVKTNLMGKPVAKYKLKNAEALKLYT
jgi:hypothetical protein